MLIGTSKNPPSREAAQQFLDSWIGSLPGRMQWFRDEVKMRGWPVLDGSTRSLEPLLKCVADHSSDDLHVPSVPDWYGDPHRDYGWTPYGAALADGLIAYVTQICADATGEFKWILDTDTRSAYCCQPVSRNVSQPPHGYKSKAQSDLS